MLNASGKVMLSSAPGVAFWPDSGAEYLLKPGRFEFLHEGVEMRSTGARVPHSARVCARRLATCTAWPTRPRCVWNCLRRPWPKKCRPEGGEGGGIAAWTVESVQKVFCPDDAACLAALPRGERPKLHKAQCLPFLLVRSGSVPCFVHNACKRRSHPMRGTQCPPGHGG